MNRKDTDIWMSGRALFERYSSCATKWWKRSASAWDSLFAYSAMPKSWCAAGVADPPLHVFWNIANNLSNVVDNREYYLDRQGVINGHPEAPA